MMSEPLSALLGKNAVYFFNPQDLEKLDLNSFENVYLISPMDKTKYYRVIFGQRIMSSETYMLSYSKLNVEQSTTTESLKFPEKKNIVADGVIYKLAK